MASQDPSNEIRIVRVYDAPVAVVWDAWTDPNQVVQWWGPRGFTLTTHSRDLRVGGHWTYTMHGPDGTDYPNKTQYLEVEKHARLVYDHGGHDELGREPLFRVTALFFDEGGKTRLEMTMTLPTPEAARQTRIFIRQAGGDGTWDRLAEYLEKSSTGRECFVINRSFDAPRDTVFSAWTDPAQLAQWMPPTGATMRFIRADIREGGRSFYEMPHPGGSTLHGLIHYLAIEKPCRLVYTQQFCDENGNVMRAPFFTHWPETMLAIVELAEEGPVRTRVTVRWEPRDATPEELAEFSQQRSNMAMGWTGSLDKLESHLAGE